MDKDYRHIQWRIPTGFSLISDEELNIGNIELPWEDFVPIGDTMSEPPIIGAYIDTIRGEKVTVTCYAPLPRNGMIEVPSRPITKYDKLLMAWLGSHAN